MSRCSEKPLTEGQQLHNHFLEWRTVRDIDRQVSKVLDDLGDPEPPLRLEVVRELLCLDLDYYSASDSGILQETVHRLKMAGKQIITRPSRLIDVLKKCDLRALWMPDRKRILIDSALPSPRQRWAEAHEIGHSVIPWHEAVMHGDKERTLSYACHQRIEAEANFAAGRLLFMQEEFSERLRSKPITFDSVHRLRRAFGNSMTSTLWRTVETADSPVLGMVSQHPRKALPTPRAIRYFIRSRAFEDRFGNVTGHRVLCALHGLCYGNRGPIGHGEAVLPDVNGQKHVFFLETFYNHHDALTLGVHRRACSTAVIVPG